MRGWPWVAVFILCGLLSGSLLLVATSAVAGTPETGVLEETNSDEWTIELTDVDEVDPDDIQIEITVDEDGQATWQIEYRIHLEDETSELAFEAIEADVESNPEPFIEEFAAQIEATVEAAQEDLDREMAIHSTTVDTTRQAIPESVGVLQYEFGWENFAGTDGEGVEVGDAIEGFYLTEDTSIVLGWQDSLTLDDVAPEPDETRETAVIWNGAETEFVTDEPWVTLATDHGDNGDGGQADDGDPAGEDDPDSTGIPLPLVLGLGSMIVLLGGLAGAVVVYRRSPGEPEQQSTAQTPDNQPSRADETTAQAPYDDELLSNDERVLRLLEHEDGRMKQQEIATTLEWTDAKTSRVIGSLREEDAVDVYRLGRENVVQLPEKPDL